ncbi:MAG: hypothetical protein Q4E69_04280 [Bacilli bacterium]|nr:hypothetical protein [Bacilli bacterium]
MKRKKTFMLLLILLVMVASGVMYAAVNGKNLVVNGYAHAKPDDSNFDVKFVSLGTEATIPVNKAGYFSQELEGTAAAITDDTHATFNVVFNKKGTTYLILKILNNSESLSANVTVDAEVTKSDVFENYFALGEVSLSRSVKKDSTSEPARLDLSDELGDITIPANQYGYVKIPVTLNKDVTEAVGYSGDELSSEYSVTVTLNAEAVQAS